MRPQIPSTSTSLASPSQTIHSKNSSDSLTDHQSCMFSIDSRLLMSPWIEKATCYHGGRVGAVDQKKSEESGKVLVHLLTLLHLKPDPTPGSPPWCLRLRSRTIPNSSASRGRCSPKLWPGPALCSAPESQNGRRLAAPRLHGGNVHASFVPVFSGQVQLRNAGLVQDSCQRLAIRSSKKRLQFDGMIWWPVLDLWTLSLKGINSNVQPDITNQSNYLPWLKWILLGETSTFPWKKRRTWIQTPRTNSNWNCLCLQRVSAWDANVVWGQSLRF